MNLGEGPVGVPGTTFPAGLKSQPNQSPGWTQLAERLPLDEDPGMEQCALVIMGLRGTETRGARPDPACGVSGWSEPAEPVQVRRVHPGREQVRFCVCQRQSSGEGFLEQVVQGKPVGCGRAGLLPEGRPARAPCWAVLFTATSLPVCPPAWKEAENYSSIGALLGRRAPGWAVNHLAGMLMHICGTPPSPRPWGANAIVLSFCFSLFFFSF